MTDNIEIEKVMFVEHTARGEIFGFGITHTIVGHHTEEPGKVFVEDRPDPARAYVKDGKVIPRPSNTTILSGKILSYVPMGATIRIDGTSYTATSTNVTLDFPYPGHYVVEVTNFPMIDKRFEVVV